MSTNTPTPDKTIVEWESQALGFQGIGFSIGDPIYYQYAIVGSTDSCGHLPSMALYTFQAYGNLDGDAVTSLYEITAGSSSQNVLMRSPGIYRPNEIE